AGALGPEGRGGRRRRDRRPMAGPPAALALRDPLGPPQQVRRHPSMPRRPARSVLSLLAWLPALALIAGCAGISKAPEPAVMDADAYAALASLDYAGSQRALERLDRSIAAAGREPARVSGLVSGMVQFIRQPAATFAARQAVAQRLGQLLSGQPADD